MRGIILWRSWRWWSARWCQRCIASTSRADAAKASTAKTLAGSRQFISFRHAQPRLNGHFHTEALDRRPPYRVHGRYTGASTIALRERDAARLVFFPPRGITNTVSRRPTASCARPSPNSAVDVGGVTVRNVAALILPDEVPARTELNLSGLTIHHPLCRSQDRRPTEKLGKLLINTKQR